MGDDLSSGYVSMYHGDTLIEHVNANSSVWRALCIYVPQALPPLNGTPISLVHESCKYTSRKYLFGQRSQISTDEVKDVARRIESKMGLSSNKLHDAWVTLSGGERQ